MRFFLALLLLAGCAGTPPDPPLPPSRAVPQSLLSCPPKPADPAALPPVVTTDRLRQGLADMDTARKAERKRGDECAGKLQQLINWILR